MDNNAIFKLTYGVFMLSTRSGEKINGCITDTCIQVADSPTRVAVSVSNSNYTCELIKESGVFAVSLLDNTSTLETIQHWGFQSGRDIDKLKGLFLPLDVNGVPYLLKESCAVLSCKVLERYDLGSHTMFIAEVVDANSLSENAPLTYADYQNNIKPKAQSASEKKKIVAWKCKICGHIYEGPELPKDFSCPVCGHEKEFFEPIYE